MARQKTQTSKRSGAKSHPSTLPTSAILNMLGNYEPSSALHVKRPRLDDLATSSSSVLLGSAAPQISDPMSDIPIPFAKRRRVDSVHLPTGDSQQPEAAAEGMALSKNVSLVQVTDPAPPPFKDEPIPFKIHHRLSSQIPDAISTIPPANVVSTTPAVSACMANVPIPFRKRPPYRPVSSSPPPQHPLFSPSTHPSSLVAPSPLRSPFILADLAASLPSRSVHFKSPIIEATPQHIRKQYDSNPSPTLKPSPPFCASRSSQSTTSKGIPPSKSSPPPIPWSTRPDSKMSPSLGHPIPGMDVPVPSTPTSSWTPVHTSSTISRSPHASTPRSSVPPIMAMSAWTAPPPDDNQTQLSPSPALPRPITPSSTSPLQSSEAGHGPEIVSPMSPMPPFPPTPGSPPIGAPKWPVSHPRSPSTVSSSEEDIDELISETIDMDDKHLAGPTHPPESHGVPPSDIQEEGETWKQKCELIALDFLEMRKKCQADPQMRRERRANVLQKLLEAEMLIGHSIDQMRDCLLKFKEDGYTVDSDVLE